MRFSQSLVLAGLLLANTGWAEEGLKYQVREGDQIATVLLHLGVCPLWGKDGAVTRAAQMNPGEIDANGDLVHPGAWIDLPVVSLAEHPKFYRVNETGEVQLVQMFVRQHWAP